ncbi:MarR family EPS-associated transcriptional regulator [Aestuariicoccus sp. MJ-SS9]|uniref:MarR family EPS-associated transcriptional regulator n=1 Tax=Aestuariicoccus sp. MJ-SS9 TaxID=3079855 RepID=UPI002914D4F6|nr:MarR family EPS-associated transcriptional regulator [Aestuariicoccus sp. MJ-SS9]MDU8913526.1 MarR family EPS-associated transcriptional regulator [Aestuariicoccus sp. MJ-SS9]
MSKPVDEDVRFRLMRLLEQNPDWSQRDIADALGVSLGATNYILKALVEKGQVKVNNFRASDNKLRYAYILTPSGIEAKARMTAGFLRRKYAEYEALKSEIHALEEEIGLGVDAGPGSVAKR